MKERKSLSTFKAIARDRWLKTSELEELLDPLKTPLPISKNIMIDRPESGTLLLFDRNATRHYKVDGHCWVRKQKTGKVREDHVKLRKNGKPFVMAYYAHHQYLPSFHRRSYALLSSTTESKSKVLSQEEVEGQSLVLVHYLDTPNTVNKKRHGQTSEQRKMDQELKRRKLDEFHENNEEECCSKFTFSEDATPLNLCDKHNTSHVACGNQEKLYISELNTNPLSSLLPTHEQCLQYSMGPQIQNWHQSENTRDLSKETQIYDPNEITNHETADTCKDSNASKCPYSSINMTTTTFYDNLSRASHPEDNVSVSNQRGYSYPEQNNNHQAGADLDEDTLNLLWNSYSDKEDTKHENGLISHENIRVTADFNPATRRRRLSFTLYKDNPMPMHCDKTVSHPKRKSIVISELMFSEIMEF